MTDTSAKSKIKEQSSKPSPKRAARNPSDLGRMLSFMCWLVFIGSIVGWGYLFYTELTAFDSYADTVERSVDAMFLRSEEILGAQDVLTEGGTDTDAMDLTDIDEEGLISPNETDEVAELVDEIEEERKDELRGVLELELPDEVDNPNFPVSFAEPTKKGVEIQVDGSGFKKQKSPYVLPSLPIGPHTINFRFLDEDEVTQNLEEKLIVIPRPPVWSETLETEFSSTEPIVLSGTALPRSKVVILVGSEIATEEVLADADGLWEAVVTEGLSTGDHSAICFVRKDGYASNFSQPFSFTVGYVEGAANEAAALPSTGADSGATDMWWDEYMTEDNYYFVIAGAGLAAIAIIIIVSFLFRLFTGGKKEENWVEEAKNGHDAKAPEQSVSLREKFASAGIGVNNGTSKDEQVSEDTKDEKAESEEPPAKKDEEDKKDQTEDKERDDTADGTESPEKNGGPSDEEDSAGTPVTEGSTQDEGLKGEQPHPKDKSDEKDKPEGPESVASKESEKKVYSKEEFMNTFKEESSMGKETKKISISLTSKKE